MELGEAHALALGRYVLFQPGEEEVVTATGPLLSGSSESGGAAGKSCTTTPRPHRRTMRRGRVGPDLRGTALEAELPKSFKRYVPGHALTGRNLPPYLFFGLFLVLPDQKESGGQSGRSQQAHEESANGTSAVRGGVSL